MKQWLLFYFAEDFADFIRKESTSCLGASIDYLYALKSGECPTTCLKREGCTSFTMKVSGMYNGNKVYMCTLYASCAETRGDSGTDLYILPSERSVSLQYSDSSVTTLSAVKVEIYLNNKENTLYWEAITCLLQISNHLDKNDYKVNKTLWSLEYKS